MDGPVTVLECSATLQTLLLPGDRECKFVDPFDKLDIRAPSLRYLCLELSYACLHPQPNIAQFLSLTVLRLEQAPHTVLPRLHDGMTPLLPNLRHFGFDQWHSLISKRQFGNEVDDSMVGAFVDFVFAYAGQLRVLQLFIAIADIHSVIPVVTAVFRCSELRTLWFKPVISTAKIAAQLPTFYACPNHHALHTLPHLQWLALDWFWAMGDSVPQVLRACPNLRHLRSQNMGGFPVLPLISRYCPKLVSLCLDISDVVEPFTTAIPPEHYGAAAERARWRGQPVPPVTWPCLERLTIGSMDDEYDDAKMQRVGKQRFANMLTLLTDAPRLRFLFLDITHGDLCCSIHEDDMYKFAKQLPSLQSIGWVSHNSFDDWVLEYGRMGRAGPDPRKPPPRRVVSIDELVWQDVHLHDEDESAALLQTGIDALDKDCFHFSQARTRGGESGREGFLRRFPRMSRQQRRQPQCLLRAADRQRG